MPTIYFLGRHFSQNSGSYEGVFENLSKFFSKRYKIIILSVKTEKTEKKFEKLSYGKVHRFQIPKVKFPFIGMNTDYLFFSLKVKKYFKKHNVSKEDVIIANGRAALGVLNKKYFLRMGQPASTFIKNMEIAKNEVPILTRIARTIHFRFQSILEQKCVKNTQAFILPSSETRDNIISSYGGKNKPYFIPFAGINHDLFQRGKDLNFNGRNILVISAGKEKIRKGIIYLERALPNIFEKHNDVNVIHIGSKFKWNLPKKYQNRINSVGKISWNKMKDYFTSTDFFVITSLQEGFPNVILESMSAGCPILTSDLDGVKEYIKHLDSGYVFERGNTKELEKGINYMLDNPKKITRFSKKAKQKIKKLDYSIYAKKLLNFLNDKNTKNLIL